MTGTTKIKQFLLGINGTIQKDNRLLNDRLCTIEHILPSSPKHWSNWYGFRDVDPEDWVQRLGNLTLMGPTDNKPGSKYNGDYSRKRESYDDSSIAVTRSLSRYDEWTPEAVTARQKSMARRALDVWSLA